VGRALLSVSDRTGIEEFARDLVALGIELVSTGGTAAYLGERGIPTTKAEEVTEFPEILGGRVKTLHPKIFGGILGNPEDENHASDFAAQGIRPIELVAVNLYDFESAIGAGARGKAAIEKIDVGGPAMIRAAAKNHARVAVLVDPADYTAVLEEIRSHGGTSALTRERLAAKAFARTALYDSAIANFFARETSGGDPFPETLLLAFEKQAELRYGENPHQHAAVYRDRAKASGELVDYLQLQGKELSFNNLLDADSAMRLARDLRGSAAVIVKHNNPCGAATGDTHSVSGGHSPAIRWRLGDHRDRARSTAAASSLQHFVEAVLADDFTEEARAAFERSRMSGPPAPVSHSPEDGRTGSRSAADCSSRTGTTSPTTLPRGGSSRSASRWRSSGPRASSPGPSRAASSRTPSSSPTPGRPSASAPAR
jgi:phosphoribosylaminoimidazolecarboxamide formyltransferase/IMP cyclohydrolase